MIYLLALQKFRVRSPLNDRTKDPGKIDEHRCHKEKIQSLKCGVRQTTNPTKYCCKRLHFPILMHAHSTRGLPKLKIRVSADQIVERASPLTLKHFRPRSSSSLRISKPRSTDADAGHLCEVGRSIPNPAWYRRRLLFESPRLSLLEPTRLVFIWTSQTCFHLNRWFPTGEEFPLHS